MDPRIAALPQEKPFLFVDEIVALEPGQSVTGAVTFAADHPVFAGHLPNRPLVPGVILIEALAQVSGLALIEVGPDGRAPAGVLGYLAEVKRVRFRRAVEPGERVLLHAHLGRRFKTAAIFEVEAVVGDEVAAEGEIVVGGMQ